MLKLSQSIKEWDILGDIVEEISSIKIEEAKSTLRFQQQVVIAC